MTAKRTESSRPAHRTDIVKRAMGHDPDAIRMIIEDLRPDLVRTASALCRLPWSHPDVEDLVQDACQVLLVALPARYRPAGQTVDVYAKGIVRQLASSARRNQRKKADIRRVVTPVLRASAVASGAGPAEARAWFAPALSALTPSQRFAIMAVDVYGWTIKETAKALGKSYSAVNSLLGHARRRLRMLEQEWSEDQGKAPRGAHPQVLEEVA